MDFPELAHQAILLPFTDGSGCATISAQAMNQIAQPLSAGRWIGRVIVGVLVAEGVWGLIVSLTRDLIVPFLARQMGGVTQSPENAGNINVPGIFTAVMALCLAGLVAVILNAWVNRPVRGRAAPVGTAVERASGPPLSIATPAPQPPVARAARVTASAAPAPAPAVVQVPSPVPVAASRPTAPAPPAAPVAAKPASPPASTPAATKPAPVAPPAKPAKPKPPKEIQYNIVGEPISPMDEDE